MISIIIIVKNDRRIAFLLTELKKINKPEKTEVIVVDASKGILQDIKEKFSYVQWIDFVSNTTKKITIPEQRNVGIRHAKGDIIVFIDADCKPDENWLISLIQPIRDESELMVAGVVNLDDQHSMHNLDQKKKLDKMYIDECPTMNVAIKKDLYEEIGMYDENFQFGSDMDLCWRARKAGYKIRLQEKAIIFHDLGSIKHDMRRMYFYGKARPKLYRKHSEKWRYFIHELHVMFYPLYFIFLPVTFIFTLYPLLLLFPVLKYRNQNPFKTILMKTVYGTGFLNTLIVP